MVLLKGYDLLYIGGGQPSKSTYDGRPCGVNGYIKSVADGALYGNNGYQAIVLG